jgi:hypothetical protein
MNHASCCGHSRRDFLCSAATAALAAGLAPAAVEGATPAPAGGVPAPALRPSIWPTSIWAKARSCTPSA